jgi:hypothetical protein
MPGVASGRTVMDMGRTRTAAVAALWLALVPVGLTACGGGEPPAFCQDLDALAASMNALRETDVSAENAEEIRTKLRAIGDDINQLSDTAKAEFEPQITEVKTQAAELQTSFAAATAAPSEDSVAAARRDVGELKNAFLDLQAALQASC